MDKILEESPVVSAKRNRLIDSLNLLKESKTAVANIMDRIAEAALRLQRSGEPAVQIRLTIETFTALTFPGSNRKCLLDYARCYIKLIALSTGVSLNLIKDYVLLI
ncbi:hypothetical protein SUGI_0174940 [Cryptomeria japonica]|nr:hypothetical protein SUGI_0174940 [Cryptomeria japonica]